MRIGKEGWGAVPLEVLLAALGPVNQREGEGSDAPLHQGDVLHVISGLEREEGGGGLMMRMRERESDGGTERE